MHSGIRGQWRVCAAAVLGGWICCTATALAQSSGDSGTAVVIPGRPDVPVIVNAFGFDASYTVVEGDFGLNKPAMINPQIVAGPRVVFDPPPRRFYFPQSDAAPRVGRDEVLPPHGQRVTQPPQTIERNWGAASDPLPASSDPTYPVNIDASPYVGPWSPWGRGRRGDDHRFRPRGGGR